jgi:hypothetical protein
MKELMTDDEPCGQGMEDGWKHQPCGARVHRRRTTLVHGGIRICMRIRAWIPGPRPCPLRRPPPPSPRVNIAGCSCTVLHSPLIGAEIRKQSRRRIVACAVRRVGRQVGNGRKPQASLSSVRDSWRPKGRLGFPSQALPPAHRTRRKKVQSCLWIFKIVLLPVGGLSLVSRRFRAASWRPCAIHLRLETFSPATQRANIFFPHQATYIQVTSTCPSYPDYPRLVLCMTSRLTWRYMIVITWNARDSPATDCLFWFPCVWMHQSISQVGLQNRVVYSIRPRLVWGVKF